MKSSDITKRLLLFCLLMSVMAGGYMLMPDAKDMRETVYGQKMAPFLSQFFKYEKIERKELLPAASILSRENRRVDFKVLTKGHITIVNFWASWCAPCLKEMPSLARFQEKHPDILIMPVSLDMQKTLPDLAKIFDNEKLSSLRWFYDDGGILRNAMKLDVYPTTYVLDKKGGVVYILKGPAEWDSKEADDFAYALLQQY